MNKIILEDFIKEANLQKRAFGWLMPTAIIGMDLFSAPWKKAFPKKDISNLKQTGPFKIKGSLNAIKDFKVPKII